MYYAFPKNYFYRVETREDFDLNHEGKVVKWSEEVDRKKETTSKFKSTTINDTLIKDDYDCKIYEELDDEYVINELGENN